MTIPTVLKLDVKPIQLTLRRPLETASGNYSKWPMVLLDLKAANGVVGHSFYHCFQPMMMRPIATLIAEMGRMIEGDGLSPVALDRKLRSTVRLIGAQGPLATAIALIEIAAWDALAKSHEAPLYQLLGGPARATPVYKTLISMDPVQAAELASEAKEQGFGGVKCKLGHADRANDLELVKRVQAAVGENVAVMGDFNQAHDAPEAMTRIQMLDDHGLVWFEEPTEARDFAGHARLALAAHTPVSFGENWRSPMEAAEAMRMAASDYAMPDLVNIGGVSAWLKTAAVAQTHGVPMSCHAFPEVCAHLMGVIATPHWLEHVDIFDDIFIAPVKPTGGTFTPNAAPGLGIAWDDKVVSHALLT